jgi:thiol:disulfide interchange protein
MALGDLLAVPIALAAAAASASPALPDGAQAAGALAGGEPRVEASLLVHPDDAPGDGRVRVAVLLETAPGWHVYGPDPGDTGLPTRIELSAERASLEPLAWPPTRTRVDDGLTSHTYEGAVILPSAVRFAGAAPPEPTLRAVVEVLACREECIPARLELRRRLDVPGPEGSAERELFASLAPAESALPGLAGAVALALLGGLLLNAMPCVLPVLALKLATFAELARLPRGALRAHALAYSLGVLSSMLVLALGVIALRAGGEAVGWGFQFREPRFVTGLAALLVAFAANLFGAFEIRGGPARLASLGAQACGARRSFFDGLLVVALATPCSAPFLGTAVGFALAGSAVSILAIFVSVAVGLAAPVGLATLLPGRFRLPRPGRWMLELRLLVGFALLATVVWLLWILSRSVTPAELMGALALLWAVGLVCFGVGVAQRAGLRLRPLPVAAGAVALLALGAGTVQLEAGDGARAPDARVFEPEAVERAVRAGRTAFVYFTADWCVTCKVNERLVLADDRVGAALAELDVAVFRADWTRRDEGIRAVRARQGRAGVPAYLVYRPGVPDRPRVLPEILTVDLLVGALRGAAGA